MPITDGKTFCILPWIHMNLNPDGAVTLCCQSHDKICDDEGRALNAQTHSLTEIWNSPAMRDIRRDMAEGKLRPACVACVRNESFDRLSHRTYTNMVWMQQRPEGTAIAKQIDQSKDWEAPPPRYVDFRLGNMCNLKCTACKPLYSSQIERDPVQSQWVPKDAPYTRLNHRFGAVSDWQEADELSEEIIALSGSLSLIQLAGGEPTINKTQIALLQKLVDEDRARDIDLEVVTNLSNVRQEVFDLYSSFRTLTVAISIDGTGAMYEYVRYPGKWSVLTRNIARLRATRPNVDLKINAVLQAVNALNVMELIDWALDDGINISLSIGRGLDDYNDVRILPPEVRQLFRAQVDEFLARKANWLAHAPTFGTNLKSILKEIDTTDFPDDVRPKKVASLMQFVNDMDKSRDLSFKEVAPSIYQGLVEYYGGWIGETRYA